MNRLALCLCALAIAAAAGVRAEPASARGYANPSALIAAEIALRQLSEKEGRWKAWRSQAAESAQLLVPEPVAADAWLRSRSEPASGATWEPHAAWMSCDGSLGAVQGGWSEGDASGLYAALWQRQEDGSYKWLMRQRIGAGPAGDSPDMLSAQVADCQQRARSSHEASQRRGARRKYPKPVPLADVQTGYSADRSLYWRWGSDEDGIARLLVAIRKEGALQVVLGSELGTPPAS